MGQPTSAEQIAQDTSMGQGMAGIGNLATGLYSIYQGIKDKREYKELAKNLVRPIFEIPEAAIDSLDATRNLAAPKTTALDDIALQKNQASSAAATSKAIGASTSSQDLLAAITGIDANEKDANTQILERSIADYNARQERLRQEQAKMAEWQSKKQDFDKIDPFYEKAAAISALRNSSERNIAGGIGNTVQGATSLAQTIAMGGFGG